MIQANNIAIVACYLITIQSLTELQQYFLEATNSSSQCSQIPYNFATRCNITCSQCSTQSDHKTCTACPDYMLFLNDSCHNPIDKIYDYRQYFSETTVYNADIFNDFLTQQGSIDQSNIVKFCIADKYRFQMVGMFGNNDDFGTKETYPYEISDLIINFRLFFLTENVTVTIFVNERQMYTQTILSGITTSNTIQVQNGTQYAIIANDPSSYIDKVFFPVRTPVYHITGFNFRIKILVSANLDDTLNTTDKYWAINELTVTGIKCDVCISQYLYEFRNVLAIIIGISAAIVLVILLILYLYLRIKQRNMLLKSKSKFESDILVAKSQTFFEKVGNKLNTFMGTQQNINKDH